MVDNIGSSIRLGMIFWFWLEMGLSTGFAQPIEPNVIYGPDNRYEYFEILDPSLRLRANATPALFRQNDLVFDGERVLLPKRTYGQVKGLCRDQPFFNQRVASFSELAFGFDYHLGREGDSVHSIAIRDLYFCKSLEARKYYPNGVDYAIVRLDRQVTDRIPFQVHYSGALDRHADLAVLGYPSGLPLKLTDQARVRDVKAGFFTLDADTFAGNSGSPVINSRTLEIEGILVRGDADYLFDNSRRCTIERHCSQNGCIGESATLASALQRVLEAKKPTPSIESATALADPVDGSGRIDVLLAIPEVVIPSSLVLELAVYSRVTHAYEKVAQKDVKPGEMAVSFGFSVPDPDLLAWGGCKGRISLKRNQEILESDQFFIKAYR